MMWKLVLFMSYIINKRKLNMQNWLKWAFICSLIHFSFMIVAPLFTSEPIIIWEYTAGLVVIWAVCFFLSESHKDAIYINYDSQNTLLY